MGRWDWVRLARALIFFCGWLSACSQAIYHQVRAGDTLSELAVRYGVSTAEIARYNAIPDPDKLYVGQMLRIPFPMLIRVPYPRLVPQTTGKTDVLVALRRLAEE